MRKLRKVVWAEPVRDNEICLVLDCGHAERRQVEPGQTTTARDAVCFQCPETRLDVSGILDDRPQIDWSRAKHNERGC